jgi:outer membrane protein TolC
LTIQDALKAALEHNYALKIRQLQHQQVVNNNSYGNAGFLPDVSLNGNQTNSINNVNQQLASGLEIQRDNAKSSNLNGALAANWTVFDGLKMFYSKHRLEEVEKQSELEIKGEVNNTAYQVLDAYYTIVDLQNRIRALDKMVTLSGERQKLTIDKLSVGLGSAYDTMQASIDSNQDKAEILILQQEVLKAKADLSTLTGQKDFTVTDTLITSTPLNIEDLKKNLANNLSILNAESTIKIAKLQEKEIRSERLPRISVGGGYNFLRTSTEAGFVLQNQTTGLSYGLSLTYPLFNGGDVNRRAKNAALDRKIAELTVDDIKERLSIQFELAAASYNSLMQSAQLEEQNIKTARLSNEIVLERYKLGTISALEFRQNQVNYLNAQTRLSDAQYRAKLAEANLLLMVDQVGK